MCILFEVHSTIALRLAALLVLRQNCERDQTRNGWEGLSEAEYTREMDRLHTYMQPTMHRFSTHTYTCMRVDTSIAMHKTRQIKGI